MTDQEIGPLLLGEVFVDYTVTARGMENKLRLGGVVHAARALWALGLPFRVAAVLPEYLIGPTKTYLDELGCKALHVIGTVRGAPNVVAIFDATEVADQGYEALLHDEKTVSLTTAPIVGEPGSDALVFPGSYDLGLACALLPPGTKLHLDVAYDVAAAADLAGLHGLVETILISTSSSLFRSINPAGVVDVLDAFAGSAPATVILKENRGGARLITAINRKVEELPAQLGVTANSVGVGDVFAAAFVAHLGRGAVEAGWRATYASAAYSQTTYPDLFRRYVQRDLRLTLEEMRALWGTFLPWERRQSLQIYFAAPDFSGGEREALDRALSALSYHNFRVRRPVVENGELPPGSDTATLRKTYLADCELLEACDLVFAVPTGRDPGTLVEVGLAIGAGIPVVVFDPASENMNTMVMAGADHYSGDLDLCLNAVFELLGVGAG